MMLGTPSHMLPEQLAGRKVDGQSDLSALGATLPQVCCGSLPFQGDSMAQFMYKIANEQPINPVTLNPALPDCLVGIINRALAKQTQERFATGDQMAKAIRECAEIFAMVDVEL